MIDNLTLVGITVTVLLCATTAFLSHIGAAVFHDGIRPVIPEFIESRMKRPELLSIAFGLSVGFIASVGIAHTMATSLLNPWLLFLTTDILGILAPKKWMAILLGGAWGIICLTALAGVDMVLTGLPVDLIGGIATLGNPVVTGFALFPLVAVFKQFGIKIGIITVVSTIIIRQITTLINPAMIDAMTMLTGIVILVGCAIHRDMNAKSPVSDASSGADLFSERIGRIKKNLPFLMLAGALIALASNIGIFAGSEVSIYTLAEAQRTYGEQAQQLVNQAAFAEFMRGVGFIPLIATTAITTGVYGVAGLTFVYVVGYLAPNPIIAIIGGAIVIFIEVTLLGFLGKGFSKFQSIRDASDNIRSSMTTVMEFALLIGSINACIEMGGNTGFFIGAAIYLINELTGRKVMRMAIGPVAAIATGIILNILYIVGLFA